MVVVTAKRDSACPGSPWEQLTYLQQVKDGMNDRVPTLRVVCEGWDTRLFPAGFVLPTLAERHGKDPNFLYAAPPRTPCAVPARRNRMKLVWITKTA
jgi:hypothetical protein